MDRLEKIMGDFKEAIVICDPQAWILLFNPQAKELFKDPLALNVRHSLYGLCHQPPLADAFRLVQQRVAAGGPCGAELNAVSFVCSTIEDATLLNCHLRLIAVDRLEEPVLVLFFNQLPRQVDETGWKASDLARKIEDLRGPLANVNAAAENLQTNPEMTPAERIEFATVIASESADLIRRFAAVVQESRALTYSQWPLTDLYSADLIRCVTRQLAREGAITVTMTGVPLWLHADSHSLQLTLEALVQAIHRTSYISEIDIETVPGARQAYLDLVWPGEPVAQTIVEAWFRLPLPGATKGLTVAAVLERHESDMWCQRHRRAGHAQLRIPAPYSQRLGTGEQTSPPARPLLPACNPPALGTLGEMADRPLSSLTFVAFNTVCTELHPSAENDILALTGVRIEHLRILSDECFQSLVNPQRPIPPSSVSRHGISNGVVRGMPPIKVALEQFKTFTKDAVLVGHNAALDLTMIKLKGEKAKVSFDHPILDTLLLAKVVLDEGPPDHSLDTLCQCLAVQVRGRQAALATALLTAQVFLRLVELLKAKGIATLSQALAATNQVRP
jgi:DNA polymerase-3 subunit epsilon